MNSLTRSFQFTSNKQSGEALFGSFTCGGLRGKCLAGTLLAVVVELALLSFLVILTDICLIRHETVSMMGPIKAHGKKKHPNPTVYGQ